MSKKVTYTVNVLSPKRWKGGWTVRYLNTDIIDAILTTDYILVQYPIKLVCTMLMESVTVISKNQKVVITNAEVKNDALHYEKLHIVNLPDHAPMDIFDLSMHEFSYEGFHGISKLKSFSISLFETFDMRYMLPKLMQVVSEIRKTFEFYTEINALDVLKIILARLNVSLNDIEFLELPDFLEVKNGQVVFTKKITHEATIIYSTTEACYTEKSFSYQYDIGNLIEQGRIKDDEWFESNIIEIKDDANDGYSLTIFGNSNIRCVSPKALFNKAFVEIDRYAKEMNHFNLINHEITVEPGK